MRRCIALSKLCILFLAILTVTVADVDDIVPESSRALIQQRNQMGVGAETLIATTLAATEKAISMLACGKPSKCIQRTAKAAKASIKAVCKEVSQQQKHLNDLPNGSKCSAMGQSRVKAAQAANEKAHKHVAHSHRLKAHTARAARASKEVHAKHVKVSTALGKVNKRCKRVKRKHATGQRSVAQSLLRVQKSIVIKKKLCNAEKKVRERAAKEKKKLNIKGPTFKFKPEPCKGGRGSFTKLLKQNDRVNVGVIPSNQYNVRVSLKTKKDVDAELWSKDGKVALVAWRCDHHNRGKLLRGKKISCIDSSGKKRRHLEYAGTQISYSGWLGTGLKFGHEFIHVKGKSSKYFMVKAFAYEAGYARVKYSWGKDKEACRAQQAKRRKERASKHAARRLAKRTLTEKGYKSVLRETALASKSCAGAERSLRQARLQLKRARLVLSRRTKGLTGCRQRQRTHQAHANKLAKAKQARKGALRVARLRAKRSVKQAARMVKSAKAEISAAKRAAREAHHRCKCRVIQTQRHAFAKAVKRNAMREGVLIRSSLVLCIAKAKQSVNHNSKSKLAGLTVHPMFKCMSDSEIRCVTKGAAKANGPSSPPKKAKAGLADVNQCLLKMVPTKTRKCLLLKPTVLVKGVAGTRCDKVTDTHGDGDEDSDGDGDGDRGGDGDVDDDGDGDEGAALLAAPAGGTAAKVAAVAAKKTAQARASVAKVAAKQNVVNAKRKKDVAKAKAKGAAEKTSIKAKAKAKAAAATAAAAALAIKNKNRARAAKLKAVKQKATAKLKAQKMKQAAKVASQIAKDKFKVQATQAKEKSVKAADKTKADAQLKLKLAKVVAAKKSADAKKKADALRAKKRKLHLKKLAAQEVVAKKAKTAKEMGGKAAAVSTLKAKLAKKTLKLKAKLLKRQNATPAAGKVKRLERRKAREVRREARAAHRTARRKMRVSRRKLKQMRKQAARNIRRKGRASVSVLRKQAKKAPAP